MNQTTEVVDLLTDRRHIYYTLPPEQAVIAAWEQYRGNWSTWTYPAHKHDIIVGSRFVYCGQFCARIDECVTRVPWIAAPKYPVCDAARTPLFSVMRLPCLRNDKKLIRDW